MLSPKLSAAERTVTMGFESEGCSLAHLLCPLKPKRLLVAFANRAGLRRGGIARGAKYHGLHSAATLSVREFFSSVQSSEFGWVDER